MCEVMHKVFDMKLETKKHTHKNVLGTGGGGSEKLQYQLQSAWDFFVLAPSPSTGILNTTKTKEMVIDPHKSKSPPLLVSPWSMLLTLRWCLAAATWVSTWMKR